MESLSEGVSYDTPRDGVTLSARRDLRSLVLPAEVSRLENLSGYVKFPGAWPVARIRLKYTARPAVAERFMARAEGDNGSGVRKSRPADPAVQDAVAKAADVAWAEGLARDGVNGVRSEIDAVDGEETCEAAGLEESGGRRAAGSALDSGWPADGDEEADGEHGWLYEEWASEAEPVDDGPERSSGDDSGGETKAGAMEKPVSIRI